VAEPVWLNIEAMKLAHDEVIALTGGPPGVRDEGLLLSALERPANVHHYDGQTDIAVLAATYAVAIAKNHPFIDGNKRTAFVGMALFLARNGWRLTASQASAIDTMLAVAASEMGIEALSGWIRDNSAQT
jgi:death-on-curing protein